MRKEKSLVSLIRKLAKVIGDEAARNPEFASELAKLLPDSSSNKRGVGRQSQQSKPVQEQLPDIHKIWSERGEEEFRYWGKDQSVQTLRALIRAEDLDPTRKTNKWSDVEKLASYLSDGLKARKGRGSAFLDKTD